MADHTELDSVEIGPGLPASEGPPELFLHRLRREGRHIPLQANSSLDLDDPEHVYIVLAGQVEIFAARMRDGKIVAPRHHVLSVGPGEGFFGMHFSAIGDTVGVLATGLPDTDVLGLPRRALQEMAEEIDSDKVAAVVLDRWIEALSAGIVRALVPKDTRLLDPEMEVELPAWTTVTSREGVVWVRLREGQGLFADREDVPPIEPGSTVPLSTSTCLRATRNDQIEVFGTRDMMAADAGWRDLSRFHALAIEIICRNIALDEAEERKRFRRKAESNRDAVTSAMAQIAAVMDPEIGQVATGEVARHPLLAAARLVAEATGIDFTSALQARSPDDRALSTPDIARFGNFRYREVTFEGRWWTHDNGSLLAFLAENGQPVALLPRSPGVYELVDPLAGTRARLTPDLASGLDSTAFMFYRSFPAQAMKVWDLIRFGAYAMRRDLITILLMGVFAGLLGLIIPITTQVIFDTVVPYQDRTQLLAIGFFLFAAAFAAGVFQIVRGIAVLRVEGRMDASIQSAIWDRLLALPVPFFRRYSAGDLGNRAMGFTMIRQILTGPVITTVLTAVFSSFNLVLLFYFSVPLALIALLLIVVATGVTGILSYLALRPQRTVARIEGKISGLVLEVINGIGKVRVAGAEDRVFSVWGEQFADQRRSAYKARELQNWVLVFNSGFTVLAGLVIFAAYGAAKGGLSTGSFIAFNAAFTQVLLSGLQLTAVFAVALTAVPLYERLKPILDALPEVDNTKVSAGVLAGDIEASHITFRYGDDGPIVLDDVSIRIRPGEMVALVGPSGSGKSSILRLLMGFEEPESGAVYYDGQDLATLNVSEVRRQIGTVIQGAKVMSGTIYKNIVGSSLLTLDDAWEAARMAGVERDIKALPMGMHTQVTEEGGTFSGGQAQRLLIARALARRPRIVFFDEATSALDNVTQELVSKSLEELNATRLVIAHRLSTIVNADRIYVMQRGKVVQTGTYSQLMQQPGLFADLARRQIL